MGVNKVILNTPEGEHVIVDMSGVSVAPETLFVGETALDKAGEMIEGRFTLITELSQQDALISQIQTALEGKAAGGGGLETCTVRVHAENSIPKMAYLNVNESGQITSQLISTPFQDISFVTPCNAFLVVQSESVMAVPILTNAELLGFLGTAAVKAYAVTASPGGSADIYLTSGQGGN